MLRLEVTDEDASAISASPTLSNDEDSKNGSDELSKMLKNAGATTPTQSTTLLQQQLNRRQKGLNKCKNPVNTTEYVDELEKIGHHEVTEFNMLIENGFYYVHRGCAMWSVGVIRDPISDTLSNVSTILKQSLSRKCSFCNHYGASVSCKLTCSRTFHLPCVAASGSFQVYQTSTIFCIDHLGQVPLHCKCSVKIFS
jgi:[histone H3]-lysine4 N-trimethyltransferase MLL3